MNFVYLTSKKVIINGNTLKEMIINEKPFIAAGWHSRIMMLPLSAKLAYKDTRKANFAILSSQHKDGKFVGNVMKKFGFQEIEGSSKSEGSSKNRGGALAIISIIKAIRSGKNFFVTPDGPQGPRQKVKGAVVNIAKITGCPMLPMSCSTSHYKILNTWDKFFFPLPFSKFCIYIGEPIIINKDASEKEVERVNKLLELKLNEAMKKADEMAGINKY